MIDKVNLKITVLHKPKASDYSVEKNTNCCYLFVEGVDNYIVIGYIKDNMSGFNGMEVYNLKNSTHSTFDIAETKLFFKMVENVDPMIREYDFKN
jgi:hypothetical protein